MRKIRLADKLKNFGEHWSPKIVGELNGQVEDEMFLVLQGRFRMDYRKP